MNKRLRLVEPAPQTRHWLSEATHELRTPLAVMQAIVEAMQDHYQQPDEKTLDLLHREIRGLGRLVDDLHWLACYDEARPAPLPEPIDMGKLLGETTQAFETRFRAAGLKLDLVLGAGPFELMGDEHQLRRLLVNLFENSLNYTDPGGTLRVECRRQGGQCRLDLDDTSPGVPPHLIGRLCERFYQVDPFHARRRRGSGLGLSICRGIVEGHQGVLRASPSPLGGLHLEIALPALSVSAAASG